MKIKALKHRWNQYRRKKRWWSIIFDFIILALIIIMLIPSARKSFSVFIIKKTLLTPRESTKTILLSQEEWNMVLIDQTGETRILSEFMDKPLLINFWATWCSPCIAELPSFQKLYDKYKDKIYFVFIVNEPVEEINDFLYKKNYTFPCFRLTDVIPEIFENGIIPTTYLIYDDNVIIYKTGAARWDSAKFMRLLDKIITS
jgi:thiol-disulfide isomerase/thioredoxin